MKFKINEGGTIKREDIIKEAKIANKYIRKMTKKPKINESISREDVWGGAINVLDGEIEEVHTYEEASNADFHHSFYFSDLATEKPRKRKELFCVRRKNNEKR